MEGHDQGYIYIAMFYDMSIRKYQSICLPVIVGYFKHRSHVLCMLVLA
jgi:hypothetical protein